MGAQGITVQSSQNTARPLFNVNCASLLSEISTRNASVEADSHVSGCSIDQERKFIKNHHCLSFMTVQEAAGEAQIEPGEIASECIRVL